MTTASDVIVLEGMEFFTHHGETEAERVVGIRLSIDAEVRTDLRRPALTDDLNETIDYATIFEIVRSAVEAERHHLLEAVAGSVADALLAHPRVTSVRVRVGKQPPIAATIRAAAVIIERDGS